MTVRKRIIRLLVHLQSWLQQVAVLRASHSEGHREGRVAAGGKTCGQEQGLHQGKCHRLAPTQFQHLCFETLSLSHIHNTNVSESRSLAPLLIFFRTVIEQPIHSDGLNAYFSLILSEGEKEADI